LGEQKLNFSVWKGKIGENNQDNQIQSITLCNMYFSKKVTCSVQWCLGQSPIPEAGEFSRIFALKVTLK